MARTAGEFKGPGISRWASYHEISWSSISWSCRCIRARCSTSMLRLRRFTRRCSMRKGPQTQRANEWRPMSPDMKKGGPANGAMNGAMNGMNGATIHGGNGNMINCGWEKAEEKPAHPWQPSAGPVKSAGYGALAAQRANRREDLRTRDPKLQTGRPSPAHAAPRQPPTPAFQCRRRPP